MVYCLFTLTHEIIPGSCLDFQYLLEWQDEVQGFGLQGENEVVRVEEGQLCAQEALRLKRDPDTGE